VISFTFERKAMWETISIIIGTREAMWELAANIFQQLYHMGRHAL
jgi:hypothetical protein